MPRVSRYLGSIAGRKPTGSTPRCCSAGSWGGCVANGAIAAWCAYRRLPKRTAKRPNRERECLVKERTRLVNRMKGTLARLGIRNFRPTLRNAAKHLAALSTPEGSPLPPNDRLDARNRRRESHAEPQNPEWQPPALANQSR